MNLLGIQDIFLGIVYLGIIYTIAYGLKSRQQKKGLDSQYFIGGLTAKLIGVTAFCLIYGLYYGGGDTIDYYNGSLALANLMTEDFDAFCSIVFDNELEKNLNAFTTETGYPAWHIWRDPNSFSVSRYSSILCLLGAKSFFITRLLTAAYSYIGIWKLYRLFTINYPDAKKALEGVQLPIAGFRGSGLAWMVDILSGVLTGGNHAGRVKDPFDDFSGPQNIGHLFITFKANLFQKNYNQRIKDNIKTIKKLPKIKGVKEIMYPGQNKFNRYTQNLKKEISISDIIKKDIETLINK